MEWASSRYLCGHHAIEQASRRWREGRSHIQIRLVLLRHFRDILQVADLALHAINALDHDEDLPPRPPRARPPVRDSLPQYFFERFRVVVLEGPDQSAGSSTTSDDRAMIELVAHDEVASSHEGGYSGRIRPVAHVEHDRVLLAHELRAFRFELSVERGRADARPRAATTRRPLPCSFEYGFATSVHPVVGEAQVVVGAQVQTPTFLACLDQFRRLRMRLSFLNGDPGRR